MYAKIHIVPLISPLHEREYYEGVLNMVKKAIGDEEKSFVEIHKPVEKPSQAEELKVGKHDIILLLFITGGTSRTAKHVISSLTNPLILVSLPYHNSLPSLLSARTLARDLKRRHIHIHVASLENATEKIRRIVRTIISDWKLKEGNIVVMFGEVSDKHRRIIEENIGCKILPVSSDDIRRLEEDITETDIYQKTLKTILQLGVGREEAEKLARLTTVMIRVAGEYKANIVTFDCFDYLVRNKLTPCIPFSILNSWGIIAPCECDIESGIALYYTYKILGKPGWMVNLVNVEGSKLEVAHCTIPLSLLSKPIIQKHFESGYPHALTGVILNELVEKECTLLRISIARREITAIRGRVERHGPLSPNQCRMQATIKVYGDAYSILEKLTGNHHIVAFDNIVDELKVIALLNEFKLNIC